MVETLQKVSRKSPGPVGTDVWDWLLWTYGDQRAHQVLGLPGQQRTPDAFAGSWAPGWKATAIVAQYGFVPDCWGSGADGGGVHPDAAAVHAAVLALTGLRRGVVLEYAIRGCVPEWEVPIMMLPVLDARGQPLVIRDRGKRAIACVIEPTADRDEIEWARKVYGYWHDGLGDVAAALLGSGLSVTGPATDAEPWNGA